MKRRGFIAADAATLAAPAVRAQGAKVIKFAPPADLALLDPHFAPALVTRNHAYLVYDTLYGVDDEAKPHPQMAAGHVVEDNGLTWKITLRDGLKFHDGTPVLVRDCVASLKRWATRDVYGISVWGQVEEVSAPSDKVIQFKLKRPFRLLSDLLGKQNPFAPVIMPERLANMPPAQQITEVIGSTPFRYVAGERMAGSRNVYEKWPGYVPRHEPAVGSTGGKVVHVDRVEWHTIPDPATTAAPLNFRAAPTQGDGTSTATTRPSSRRCRRRRMAICTGRGRTRCSAGRIRRGSRSCARSGSMRRTWRSRSASPMRIQLQAFQDVPCTPLGAFYFASAYRSSLSGMVKGGIPTSVSGTIACTRHRQPNQPRAPTKIAHTAGCKPPRI